jgi:hypothetical protein
MRPEINEETDMVSGRGAKRKGDRFEIEIAKYLNDKIEGLDAYRTPLSGMRGGREFASPDISNTPSIAIEAKRTETISARKWMQQAIEAAGDNAPVVITRQNRDAMDDALVIMRLGDWVKFYGAVVEAENAA